MGLEQYKGLLFLISGISFFTIMLLSLRLLASKNEGDSSGPSESEWTGIEALEVVEIIQETPDVKSFKLKRQNGMDFPPFKGGQFLSFQIGDDPGTTRSYSLSSPEQNRHSVQVSVKKIIDGKGSGWFHQLKVGAKVLAYAPSGHFVDDGQGSEDRVLVAGGIGVTPILSILLSNLDKATTFTTHIFYGARTEKDLAFHGLFLYLSQRHPQVHYYPVLSMQKDWSGDSGYLTMDFIKTKIRDVAEKRFFICGPDPMTEPLLDAIEKSEVHEGKVFSEKFISPSSLDDTSIPERELTISWNGKKLQYKGKKNLLDFLESQGEFMPFACRAGVCGSCKCKIQGQYKMLTDAGLTRKEKKNDYALACVSFPEGDIEISPV